MIVVLWKAAAGTQAGEVGEWLCGHRQRIIIEYVLPKSAWSVVVVETEGMGPLNCRRTPPEIGLLTTDNPAEGMPHCSWIRSSGNASVKQRFPARRNDGPCSV